MRDSGVDVDLRARCAPAVTGFRFDGADLARTTPEVEAAFAHPDPAGVVVCPSNPYVSIGPLLAVERLRTLLRTARVPVTPVAVSST